MPKNATKRPKEDAVNRGEQQPTIVKYIQSARNGTRLTTLHRHAIGYVIRGRRYLHHGDTRYEIEKDDVYYLGIGNHYVEDIPEPNKAFEQIVFYYDTLQINKILNYLSLNYRFEIRNDHECSGCRDRNAAGYPVWPALKSFFTSVGRYLDEGVFGRDSVAENLKMTELAYLLITNPDCCPKRFLLNNIDSSLADFEQTVYDSIFSDLTIEELARKCDRSLTSFKKEFRKHFNEPPHKWFIRQRLTHARLQVISSKKSIARIGIECGFPNTSHFIKLFKKEYRLTPIAYRRAGEKTEA